MTATTVDRKATPTGVLVARLDPITQRAEWLTERRNGIGGSEIPAMLGMDRYKSELDLYLDKIGEGDDDAAGEAAFWGTILEDPVARVWADRNRVKVARVGTIAHHEHLWMRVNLDRRVHGCPDHERCALEVKTRSAWKAGEWSDELPDDVEAQCQWALGVTGLDALHVAALIGGQQFKQYVVAPDPELIDNLRSVGERFWHDHVLPEVPPQISSLDLLVDMLAGLDVNPADVLDLTGDQATQVHELLQQRRELKATSKRCDEVDKQLKAIAGDKAVVRADGMPAYSFKTVKSRRFNSSRLKAADPDLYEEYRDEQTTRRLDIDRAHR